MFYLILKNPIQSGLIIGFIIAIIRIFIFPIILNKSESLHEYFYTTKVLEILNSSHSIVVYDLSSEALSQKKPKTFIKDPLRIEDDIISGKQMPFIFFDPSTLRVKGYFYATNKETIIDKYSEIKYEGYLVLIKNLKKEM